MQYILIQNLIIKLSSRTSNLFLKVNRTSNLEVFEPLVHVNLETMNKKLLSKMAYGRYLGLSETSIRNAIKSGKIVDGWDPIKRKVIVAKADIEFGNHYKAKMLEILKSEDPKSISILKLANAGDWCKKILYKFELQNQLIAGLSGLESQFKNYGYNIKNESTIPLNNEELSLQELNNSIITYSANRIVKILTSNLAKIPEYQITEILDTSESTDLVEIMFELFTGVLLESYSDWTQEKGHLLSIAKSSPIVIINTFRTLIEQNSDTSNVNNRRN